MNAATLIREARRAAGLSQVELARRAGKSQPEIARLESPGANPRLQTVSDVVAAAGSKLELSLGASDGIDSTLIADALRSSPDDRLRTLEEMLSFADSLRGAKRRRRG